MKSQEKEENAEQILEERSIFDSAYSDGYNQARFSVTPDHEATFEDIYSDNGYLSGYFMGYLEGTRELEELAQEEQEYTQWVYENDELSSDNSEPMEQTELSETNIETDRLQELEDIRSDRDDLSLEQDQELDILDEDLEM